MTDRTHSDGSEDSSVGTSVSVSIVGGGVTWRDHITTITGDIAISADVDLKVGIEVWGISASGTDWSDLNVAASIFGFYGSINMDLTNASFNNLTVRAGAIIGLEIGTEAFAAIWSNPGTTN